MPKVVKASVDGVIGLEDPKAVLAKIEHCGRTAYRTWDKECEGSAEKFVAMIVKLGHESVLEHVQVTVMLTCDRATAQQLTRHRLASFTMESQRYCSYGSDRLGNEITFVDPEIPLGGKKMSQQEWEGFMGMFTAEVEEMYMKLLQCGIAPEDARCILPNCTACKLAMTANLREWRHIFKLRTDIHAQHNIRSLMSAVLQRFREAIPCVFSDIQ